MDKILVEIAAYLDPDLLNTVTSAIKQSDYPDRVFFSICYQGDDLKDYEVLRKIPNCKIKHLKESEVQGLCYARYLCEQMIEDEKYIYQIDSHMRFVKHWDTEMIRQLLSLNDQKAFISSYPANLDDEMVALPVNDVAFSNPTLPTINFAKNFYDDNFFIQFDSRFANPDELNQLNSPFISGGNLFSFAKLQKEVPHDPKMYWHSDELAMAIRYYTNGWSNYTPKESYIYHKYFRKNRAIHHTYAEGKKIEEKRFAELLNLSDPPHDLGKYGLGQTRTLAQFESCTGINFTSKTINAPTSCYSIPK